MRTFFNPQIGAGADYAQGGCWLPVPTLRPTGRSGNCSARALPVCSFSTPTDGTRRWSPELAVPNSRPTIACKGRRTRSRRQGRAGSLISARGRWARRTRRCCCASILPESGRRRGQTSREQRNGGRTANAQCVQCRWHNRSDVPTGEIGFIPGVGGMLDLWCLDPERRPRPRKKGANARATSNQCATPASPTASLRRGATRPCRPARAGSRCD